MRTDRAPLDRTDRTLETREEESRATSWAPPSLLPMPSPVPGFKFRWIRKSIFGDLDPTNMSQRRGDGWEPVKPDSVPELTLGPLALSGQEVVEVGGLILCKAPEEFLAQRQKYYENINRQQIKSADQQFKSVEDRRAPLFDESKSEVRFGSGR